MAGTPAHKRCLLAGFGCAACVFFWQALTVQANYQGKWNALFCTGAQLCQPPELANEQIYLFPSSHGYDGQMYHYIAHDPFFRRGFAAFVDAPRIRYRRILVPLAAHILALGRDQWVDRSYLAVILIALFCGGYWLSLYFTILGYRAVYGVGFVFIPATLISMDRLTVDVALVALCVAFALFAARGSMAALYGALAGAVLTRETGFLLIGAYVVWLLFDRKPKRAALFLTSAFPALLWYLVVELHTEGESHLIFSPVPFNGLASRLLHSYIYHFSGWVNMALTAIDYAALAGIVTTVALALWMAFQREWGSIEAGIYAFAPVTVFLNSPEAWTEVYAFGRILSPLLVLLALVGLSKRSFVFALPLLLVIPRTAIQLAPQAAGILHYLHSG